jgi:hypothetical protein
MRAFGRRVFRGFYGLLRVPFAFACAMTIWSLRYGGTHGVTSITPHPLETAGADGFFTLIQLLLGPDRYGCSRCFETMPSRPSLQAWGQDDGAVPDNVLVELNAWLSGLPQEVLEPAPRRPSRIWGRHVELSQVADQVLDPGAKHPPAQRATI